MKTNLEQKIENIIDFIGVDPNKYEKNKCELLKKLNHILYNYVLKVDKIIYTMEKKCPHTNTKTRNEVGQITTRCLECKQITHAYIPDKEHKII